MGRPKKDNPKNKGIRIRVTEYELMVLKEMSKLFDMSVTELFREGIGKVWSDRIGNITEEELKIFIDRTFELSEKIRERSKA